MSAGCWFGSCGGHFDTVDEVTDNCHGGNGGGIVEMGGWPSGE